MELIFTLAMKFWQWTILIAVVIIGAIINFTDKRKKPNLKFNFKGFPELKPLQIKTKGKGFWKGIILWLLSTRNWELTKDWKYNINGTEYVIPAGFQFDGASIPTLLEVNKKKTMGELTQKRADEIFRDINIVVNGFYSMNHLAYWSLRIGGFVAWNGHRKRNNKIPELK